MKVYDFDGTIYDGDSSLDFFCFVLRKRPYLFCLLPFQLLGMLQYTLRIVSKEKLKEGFFVFIRFIPIDAMVSSFWESHYHKVKPWYVAQKQDSDVIISASPEFLLAAVVRDRLQVGLIASILDVHTARYIGKNCYGEEKVRRFRERYGDAEIDEFYSDSCSDAPLAEKAHRSFIVKGTTCIPWQEYTVPSIKKAIKQTYFTKDFMLFVFCGGMGTLVNFVFSLLISTKVNPSLSYICGYGISLSVAYSLNAKLIFHNPLRFIAFFKFVISYIPNFLILFSFVLVFLNIFGWNKIIVYGLAGLLGLPITFLLVKIFAFGKQK
jgi:putative flippase GtrA